MKLADVKNALLNLTAVNFKLPNGDYLPAHFHITEIGLVTKHFIDCGGVEREDTVINFQLWEAGDYDHRIAAQKFLHILELPKKMIGKMIGKVISEADDFEVEVEYQQATIGRFDLAFDGVDFILTNKQTDCLAKETCTTVTAEDNQKKSCC